jgi:hypothetical protein
LEKVLYNSNYTFAFPQNLYFFLAKFFPFNKTFIFFWLNFYLFRNLYLFGKVVKTEMMQPFCIRHHINVHPNVSITFVTINAPKKFITLRLPPLRMMTKNRFGHHRIGDQIFHCLVTELGNQIFLIANFWSPQLMNIFFQFAQKHFGSYPNNFNCLVNNGH